MQAQRLESGAPWLIVVLASALLMLAWIVWLFGGSVERHARSEILALRSTEEVSERDEEGSSVRTRSLNEHEVYARFAADLGAELHLGQAVVVYARDGDELHALDGTITGLGETNDDSGDVIAQLRVRVEANADPLAEGTLTHVHVELEQETPLEHWLPSRDDG